MPAAPVEIRATYLRERFRFDNADGDVIIGAAWANSDINAEISIKGQADADELQADQTYRFYGRWTEYKNKRSGKTEKQFAFDSFVRDTPATREGVIAYLKQIGQELGVGFGHVRAAKCWEVFGSDAVAKLRTEPQEVAETLRRAKLPVPNDGMEKLTAKLVEEQRLESCMLDVIGLLAGRGFRKSTARLAVRKWGNRASAAIRRCAYRLMAFDGAGFKLTDKLYLDLGGKPDSLIRQGLCCWHACASDSDGHTWFYERDVLLKVKAALGDGSKLDFDRALKFAKRIGAINILRTNGPQGPVSDAGNIRWICVGKNGEHEGQVASQVVALSAATRLWPAVEQVTGITEHQRGELAKALAGPVGILGGGPGTGKTFAVAKLAAVLLKQFGDGAVWIGAPTGKAAVRVTENLAGHGLSLRARTWHSLLALLAATKQPTFPARVLIGDESSMNDSDLTAAVLRATAMGTQVLLVGDVNQLPPVGHGAPLRDLIAAGLPYGELSEIMRNSGGIVEACKEIRHGRRWEPADNLQLIEEREPQRQIARMVETLHGAGFDSREKIWAAQVVVPVNKKSPLARVELNKLLQAELNPAPGIAGSAFRVGDKIVNTKNGKFFAIGSSGEDEAAPDERGEVYVANGELGEVIDVAEKSFVVQLRAPDRLIRVPRGKVERETEKPSEEGGEEATTNTGCSWDLGYALSVHKSQGSEWSLVLVMVDGYAGARRVASREFYYTAISRAKQRCVLIGERSVIDAGCKMVAIGKRKTLLRERTYLLRAEEALANL